MYSREMITGLNLSPMALNIKAGYCFSTRIPLPKHGEVVFTGSTCFRCRLGRRGDANREASSFYCYRCLFDWQSRPLAVISIAVSIAVRIVLRARSLDSGIHELQQRLAMP